MGMIGKTFQIRRMTKFDESGLPEPTKYPQMPKVMKMNERIQELMRQATNPDYDGDDGPANELNIEKFAQLIVRECVYAAVQKDAGMAYTADVAGYMAAGRSTAAQMINEHFGVKEQTPSQRMADAGYTRRPKAWTKEDEE